MWEPGGSSTSTTTTNNNSGGGSIHTRGIILLLTFLIGCFLLYKAWGPLLIITCALVIVVHTCYSLLVNDSLLTPHTLVIIKHAKSLILELLFTVKALGIQAYRTSGEAVDYLKRIYEEYKGRVQLREAADGAEGNMNGRNKNIYRLSSGEPRENASPLNHDRYHLFAMNGACNARTSTPLPRGGSFKKNFQLNGDLGLFTPIPNQQVKKTSPVRTENRQPSVSVPRMDYSPKNMHWSNNASPKMSDRPTVAKTVQTVAGPLLTSSRYNIDPKIYSDINSPGLTSRLTKYASEANAKLTHLPQYGTGQFPKVNLNASPKPLLSPKTIKSRTPVTVRVAPPEIVSYSPSDSHLHQEKNKMFPSTSTSELRDTQSCPSVVQVLKEISLKRHASREDIMLDLVKKQRFERAAENRLENFEEIMQKRGRDDSASSDDLSPKSKTERPTKRSKSSSCHDVINSLSSSIHVLSGVKRKAMDTSRCATPEIEKHFKPSSRSPDSSSSLSLHLSSDTPKTKEQLNVKVPITTKAKQAELQKSQDKSPELPKINIVSPEKAPTDSPSAFNQLTPKVHKDSSVASVPAKITSATKLTDKLFMKPEPQANEKLKTLIEEQESVGPKFTTDDKDEIKKQDIVNMRQNSMRLRLQNMFDAISGKSANKIDPDVVIQAEEVNVPAPSTSTYTSLNTLTTTTTVNTSPITTTIVPILKTDTESKSPTLKHVTFNLPTATSTFSSNASSLTSAPSLVSSTNNTKPAETKSLNTSGIIGFGGGFKPATSSSAPSFSFGSNAATSSTAASSAAAVSTVTSGFNFPPSNSAVSTAASTTSASLPTSSMFGTTSASSLNSTVTLSSTGFSFGSTANANATTATTSPSLGIAFSVPKTTEANATSTIPTPTFGNPLSKSPASISIAPAATNTLPSFGGEKKEGGFSFGNPSSTASTSVGNPPAPTFGASSGSMFSAGGNAATTTASRQPTFSFGAAAAATAAASKPTFSFGAAATNNTSATTSSTPAFGSVSTVISGAAFGSAASTGSAFGSPAASLGNSASTSAASAPAFGSSSTPAMFGSTANSPSLFSGSATSPSTMFKSPVTTAAASAPSIFASQSTSTFKASPAASAAATTTPSIFGSQSGAPTFGATAAAAPATTSIPSLFGNATTSSSMPSLFGNAATTTAPSLPTFGSSTTQATQGSIFSGANANTAPSIFGSTPAAGGGGLFSGGANAAASPAHQAPTSASTDNASIFGQSKPQQATLSFGASNAPAFGSTAQGASFSATSSASFPGSNSAGASTFQLGTTPAPTSGALPSFNSIKPTAQFPSTPASTTTGGSSIFGSTTNSGSFNSAANAFGSSTSPFGGQPSTSTQSPAFGSAGQSSFASTMSASPFGAPTTTTASTSLFGNAAPAASTTAPTAGGSFAFGGAQTQQQQQQQPNAAFSFGAAPAAPSTSGLFQFGGASVAKPAGFNFSAPPAAPAINFSGGTPAPAFNAPAGNMFSIGSGTSTPRPRASRQRRQR